MDAITSGGCAPPVYAVSVEERILAYLRGDSDGDVLALLRDARAELIRLRGLSPGGDKAAPT